MWYEWDRDRGMWRRWFGRYFDIQRWGRIRVFERSSEIGKAFTADGTDGG